MTLTDPRGEQFFLKTGRQGPYRPADRAYVVFTYAALELLFV